MLSTTDILPIDFSGSSTQVIDSEGIIPPETELQASFSEILQGPILAAQTAVASIAGEDLPTTGSNLPLDAELVEVALPAFPQSGAIEAEAIVLEPAHSLSQGLPSAEGQQTAPIEHSVSINTVPPAIEQRTGAPIVPVVRHVANEAPLHPVGFHQQRAVVGPTLQPLAGIERPFMRAGKNVIHGADNQRSRLQIDIQKSVRVPGIKFADDSTPVVAPKAAPEMPVSIVPITTSAPFLAKEGVERTHKPNLPFSGIATTGPITETLTNQPPAAAPTRATPMLTTSIDLSVMDQAWGKSLQDRVMWMAGRGIQNAEIRLNPAELGPIRVQVTVDNEVAQLAFTAQHSQTREAIELAMPRLREMLTENGLSLAGSTVSDGKDTDMYKDRDSGDLSEHDESESLQDDDVETGVSSIRHRSTTALVDTFA